VTLSDPAPFVRRAHFTGTASLAHVTIHVYPGTAPAGAPITLTADGGAFALDADLADGTYTAVARLEDGTQSQPRTFVVDTAAPDVNTSAIRTAYARGEAASAGFTCSDGGSGVDACDGPANVDTTTAGERELTIVAVDRAGNRRIVRVPYSVSAPSVQPAAKVPSRLTITSASFRGRTLKLRGTAGPRPAPARSRSWWALARRRRGSSTAPGRRRCG
jgi:hypothetical protein